MANKEILKRKIIYRSLHRGTKEMDLLLGTFVIKNINDFGILVITKNKNKFEVKV